MNAFKGPLDDQIALAKTEADTFKDLSRIQERKQATVNKLQKEWDERDQSIDNSALETSLNEAKAERDTAEGNAAAQETKKNEENDKIAALQTTYDEKVAEKEEARDTKAIDDALTLLYGKEAEGENDAVVGVEQKVRQAEKQFNNAHVELSQAQEALYTNEDQSAVFDLVQAIKDAQDKVDQKEINMVRQQEYFHQLEMQFQGIQDEQDALHKERLDAEIAEAAAQLDGLKEAFGTAEAAKNAYDATETELKQAVTDINANADATQAEKDAAQ